MSIRFDCLGCSKKLVVHDRFEGKNVRCPTCGFEIVVPKKLKLGDELRQPLAESSEDFRRVSSKTDTESANALHSPIAKEGELNGNAESGTSFSLPKNRRPRSIQREHDHHEKDLEWDITPMVDVAFLLLIFFMLTASFSIQKVIRTSVPQSEQPSRNSVQSQIDLNVEKLIVQVDEFNAYTVVFSDGQTHEASSKQELITILKDFRVQAGDQLPRIVIQAHVDSFHGATVGCMDAAREAEFSEFQLFAVESFD